MKKLAVLGSTGSIGTQALQVVKLYPDELKVVSLVAYSNENLLEQQKKEFSPEYSALVEKDGEQCIVEACKNADLVLFALRGIISLPAVLYCIEQGKDVALANKETLICGGKLIKDALAHSESKLLPVDSEHCAIWQCLQGKPSHVYITASGGPFYGLTAQQIAKVSPERALSHPKWKMGDKITIDSATLMNKTFEVLEAHFLFDVDVDDIEILVHPQSVVHSLVEYADGSVLSQLAVPDMRLPIQYALLEKEHRPSAVARLDPKQFCSLTFDKCDFARFPCAELAYKIKNYDWMTTVLCAADDVCVQSFLDRKIPFGSIYLIVKAILERYEKMPQNFVLDCEHIFNLDKEVRQNTAEYIKNAVFIVCN